MDAQTIFRPALLAPASIRHILYVGTQVLQIFQKAKLLVRATLSRHRCRCYGAKAGDLHRLGQIESCESFGSMAATCGGPWQTGPCVAQKSQPAMLGNALVKKDSHATHFPPRPTRSVGLVGRVGNKITHCHVTVQDKAAWFVDFNKEEKNSRGMYLLEPFYDLFVPSFQLYINR